MAEKAGEPRWEMRDELAALQVELTWEVVRTLRAMAAPGRRPPKPLHIPRPGERTPTTTPAGLALMMMRR